MDTKLIFKFIHEALKIKIVDLLFVFSCLSCLMFLLNISYEWRTPSVYVGLPLNIILFYSWRYIYVT